MEGYKSFRETVLDASRFAEKWTYTGSGEPFDKDELLAMAEAYDELYKPDGWNYFVAFPQGEIGVLSTEDNTVEWLFLPKKEAVQ